MNNSLIKFGNIPITASALESLFPDIVAKNQKIRLLEKKGELIRLKRGLYVGSPKITGKVLSTELIANHLYAPSYISMSSALCYYGLIPEAVYTVQSMTLKHWRTFDIPVGRFDYITISRSAFSIGLTSVRKEGYAFIIATPEKALCDLIANSSGVNLRYLTDVRAYLEEDIRFNMDELKSLNINVFKEYINVGKKSNSIKTLLSYLTKPLKNEE